MRDRDTTSTEPAEASSHRSDTAFGIQWVWPRARFDRLCSAVTLGRAETCSIRLDSTQVSREHAAIQREGPLWVLRDLGSKNGSWINASRQALASVAEQDVLRIGDHVGVACSLPTAVLAGAPLFQELLPGIVASAATFAGLRQLDELARRVLPVVVRGETGTGKEVLARALHERSGRGGKLIALNSAAIPRDMAEGLLFGHRKGAFTGASTAAQGLVQAARGGTLFLDEVEELPPAIQAKLLRVLEQRSVTPLGATDAIAVDFRLIVACQGSLADAVSAGRFRADLYARVRGAELLLPPLRARRQEIVALLTRFFQLHGAYAPALEPRLVEALCVHDWPYNVRELAQLAGVFEASRKERLGVLDLPASLRELLPRDEGDAGVLGPSENALSGRRQAWLSRHRSELERLRAALLRHRGNLSLAASEVGVPRHRARRLLDADAEREDARGE